MFHPLEENLRDLNDQELDKKLNELTKKYHQVARLGYNDVLTQLETFVTIYKNEISRRHQEKLSHSQKNLDKIINVD